MAETTQSGLPETKQKTPPAPALLGGGKRKREGSDVKSAPGSAQHASAQHASNVIVDCGWGRLLFAQTFADHKPLIEALRAEAADTRDIAFYVNDPHVLLAQAPQELFLDPSHTYRLDLDAYEPDGREPVGFDIRPLASTADAEAVNLIYAKRGMVTVQPGFFGEKAQAPLLTYLVAVEAGTGRVVGTVTGVDHVAAFNDRERGASLWCLAVEPTAASPGVGEALVRRLAEHYKARGAAYLDLSVMHDNEQAIALYEKLGFERIACFAVKRKNPINEPLFIGPAGEADFNPYARIIVDEARRRGIHVEPIDAEGGFFRLTFGGRAIRCRESLSELTSAVAMSICDDKAATARVVGGAGVAVPEQIDADAPPEAMSAFLRKHGSVVVKPARGEQGRGVSVGVSTVEEIERAIVETGAPREGVLIEQCAPGEDLRLIVIDFKLVAAALRRPARIVGDGKRSVRELIKTQSRRREAATGGESRIPLDAETERNVRAAGLGMDDTPEAGAEIIVRKTANLHTGGTIHDVTGALHPALAEAAIAAARAIDIPVVGIDFIVRSHTEPNYVFIEANERPGLANHEPQPTAERFIDLLFPMSAPVSEREQGG